MEKKYYKYGLRPIIEEVETEYSTFYAFQWETGEFKEDMTYASKIWQDSSGDKEDLSESEFNEYVESIKKERGL
ncbi:hypothetical protein [uncultured Lacinutrix sp.]|uniref:hypothetical protein n=1 Tax=uncultured Lacinutrix sp. TaxID=574032 RepID=UPI00261956F6|nr:hypothetical protein [uncultured Lacinutrix sp.]